MNPKRPSAALTVTLFVFGLLVSDSVHAFAARSGFKKVRIGHLFLQANASAPAQIITEVNAELINDYPAATFAYAPDGVLERMAQRAAALRLEFSVLDDYDRIFLPGGVIDARIGTAPPCQARCSPPRIEDWSRVCTSCSSQLRFFRPGLPVCAASASRCSSMFPTTPSS